MDPSGAVIHLMKFFEERAQRQVGGIPWNFLTSMFFSVHFRTSTALRRFDLSEIMTATRIMIHSKMIFVRRLSDETRSKPLSEIIQDMIRYGILDHWEALTLVGRGATMVTNMHFIILFNPDDGGMFWSPDTPSWIEIDQDGRLTRDFAGNGFCCRRCGVYKSGSEARSGKCEKCGDSPLEPWVDADFEAAAALADLSARESVSQRAGIKSGIGMVSVDPNPRPVLDVHDSPELKKRRKTISPAYQGREVRRRKV